MVIFMINDKKIAMLYILDILKEYTDQDHPLTQQDIINKLHNIYLLDIERKTIASTIRLLIDYGYDIISIPKKGYYLNERDFDQTEIKYLVDAIYSSKTIPTKEANAQGIKASKLVTKLLCDQKLSDSEELRAEMAQWSEQEEDVLSYALFPQVATDFFKYREAQKTRVDQTVADTENGSYPV